MTGGPRDLPLDPQVARLLALQRESGTPPVTSLSVEERRRNVESSVDLCGPPEPVTTVVDLHIGDVPVRLYDAVPADPEAEHDRPVGVFIHGGGWATGSIAAYDPVCRMLANRSGCQILSVEYRLAPEHPFPAGLEDCWAVTCWAAAHRRRVAVLGDSAGGNLAAVMALRARDAGIKLGAQILIYPAVDLSYDPTTETRYPSHEQVGLLVGMNSELMESARRDYLSGHSGLDAEVSPILATDCSDLAPMTIIVCDYDPLYDEGLTYAAKLTAAGVPVRTLEYRGFNHGILRRWAVIDRVDELITEIASTLRDAVGGYRGSGPEST